MSAVRRWMAVVGPFLLIALAVAALYGRTVGFDFVWDDVTLIVNNPALERGEVSAIVADFWGGAGRADSGGYFRPLSTLTFFLDMQLYGKRAGGFHATNALLYLGICWMVFVLFRHLLGNAAAAFAGAMVFAVHPVHVEPVAFISSRTDLLAALFVLAALLVGLGRLKEKAPLRQVAVAALFMLAVLAKESAVVLVAIPLVGPKEWRRRFLPPLLGGLGATVLMRALLLPSFIPSEIPQGAPLAQRLLTVPWLIVHYLGDVFWPANPSAFPAVDWVTTPLTPRFLIPLVVVAAVAALLVAVRRWAPVALFGFLWGAIFLLPVLNLVQLRMRAAERFVFLPSVGLILGATALAVRLLEGRKVRWPAVGAAAGVCCLLFALAWSQVPVWKDATSLWEATAAREPGNPSVLNNLGNVRFRQGRYPEAERLYETALGIAPDYPEALANLGLMRYRNGRRAEAIRLLSEAVLLNPGLGAAADLLNRVRAGY